MLWSWLRPPGPLLDRIRWFYLVFTVFFGVTFLPQLLVVSDGPAVLRVAAATGLVALVAYYVRGYRARRFPLWGLALEIPIYALVAATPLDPLRALGLVFIGVSFRSLYGRLHEVVLFVGLVIGGFLAVILAVPDNTEYLGRFFQAIPGAPVLAVISHFMSVAMERSERAALRERELSAAGLALARATSLADLRAAAERSAAALVPGPAPAVTLRLLGTGGTPAPPVSDPGPGATGARRDHVLVLPIDGREGTVGHLLVDGGAHGVPMESRDALTALTHSVAQSLTSLRLHDDLRVRAETDALTGLANRSVLHERLAGAVARCGGADGSADAVDGSSLASACLVIVDLDGFKTVNDTHGHAAGDAVLRATAERLRASVRDGDLVARVGGDEFAVVVSRAGGVVDADALVTRIRSMVSAPVRLEGGGTVAVGASVGKACWRPGASPDQLLLAADADMYRHKRSREVSAPSPRRGPDGPLVTAGSR